MVQIRWIWKEIKRYFYKKGTAFNYKIETEDENHAWNIIELEDGFYNIDVTSDDSGDTPIYKYFNINDNMILIDHFKDEMSKNLKYTNGSKYINTYSTLYEKSK